MLILGNNQETNYMLDTRLNIAMGIAIELNKVFLQPDIINLCLQKQFLLLNDDE